MLHRYGWSRLILHFLMGTRAPRRNRRVDDVGLAAAHAGLSAGACSTV